MNRKLMSWLSLAVLIAGILMLAYGLALLIADAANGFENAAVAFAQICVGLFSWMWGVHLTRRANISERNVSRHAAVETHPLRDQHPRAEHSDPPPIAAANLDDAGRVKEKPRIIEVVAITALLTA